MNIPEREEAIDNWMKVFGGRVVESPRVVVKPRMHEDDLTGFILDTEDIEHIKLPMDESSERTEA